MQALNLNGAAGTVQQHIHGNSCSKAMAYLRRYFIILYFSTFIYYVLQCSGNFTLEAEGAGVGLDTMRGPLLLFQYSLI
jgi:hypothetical protein